VLDEKVSPRIFVAAGIIIAGVAIITVARNRKTPGTPPRRAGPEAIAEPVCEKA
jgi:drug/metabolite transporter (DMT)-like permease